MPAPKQLIGTYEILTKDVKRGDMVRFSIPSPKGLSYGLGRLVKKNKSTYDLSRQGVKNTQRVDKVLIVQAFREVQT